MGDRAQIFSWQDKTILVTGGTGSFGNAFTRLALDTLPIHSLRVFSRDELKQWEMQRRFDDERLRFLIGDVRDRDRLNRALEGVDVVVHAAALKQVPLCEYNPLEAIKTNILGTANLIDAAIDCDVERVMVLSTDKAASPTNLYGATKLCAEKLCVQANSYTGRRRTLFSACRYGNVLGSRGSVVPSFVEQQVNNSLTITDERMTRYWVTLPHAADFVRRRIEEMVGGELFVPKLPSVRIMDLARAVAPGAELKVVGARPGEKLAEVLITEHEAAHTWDRGEYFVIEPQYQWWHTAPSDDQGRLPENYEYRSDTNDKWLDDGELRELLLSLELIPSAVNALRESAD
jgi:UDP-N-acetylglucosamine 4,6-dehydratase/5-epimerase